MKASIKISSFVMTFALVVSFMAVQVSAEYPNRPITMVVSKAGGGGTDMMMRTLAKEMEKYLNTTITCVNRTGAGGALAMQFVYQQPSDGYWILGTSQFAKQDRVSARIKLVPWKTWQYYKCANGVLAWAVKPDSPFKTFSDFIEAAKNKPGEITVASGTSGGPWAEGNALLQDEAQIKFREVSYKGGAPSTLACLQGEVQVAATGVHEQIEFIKAGKLRSLAAFVDKRVELAGGNVLEPVGKFVPGLQKFAPFGSEYTLITKRDIPVEIQQKISDAFKAAVNSKSFSDLLAKRFFFKSIVVGEDANRLAALRESVAAWLFWDMKLPMAKVNPADLDIPRVKDFDKWWPPKGYQPLNIK